MKKVQSVGFLMTRQLIGLAGLPKAKPLFESVWWRFQMSGPVGVLVEMDWDWVFKILKEFKLEETLQKTLYAEACLSHVSVFWNTLTWRQNLELQAQSYAVSGMMVEKHSEWATDFQVFSTIQGKTSPFRRLCWPLIFKYFPQFHKLCQHP